MTITLTRKNIRSLLDLDNKMRCVKCGHAERSHKWNIEGWISPPRISIKCGVWMLVPINGSMEGTCDCEKVLTNGWEGR